MSKLNFASDYLEGAHPAILQRLLETNLAKSDGYGEDEYSEAARELAKVPKPHVYAFDPAWLGETGDSGYAVAWPLYRPLKIILR